MRFLLTLILTLMTVVLCAGAAALGDDRIDGAVKLTEQASSLGGNVFVVTVVLLMVAMYIVLVVVPNARAQRMNSQKLTEVIGAMSGHLLETHGHAENASVNSEKLVSAIRIQTNIVERVNDAGPKLDIKGQLGEIRGALAG